MSKLITEIFSISLFAGLLVLSTVAKAQDFPELIQRDWPGPGDHLYLNDVLFESTVPWFFAASGFVIYAESKTEVATYDHNFKALDFKSVDPYQSVAFSSGFDCSFRLPIKSFSASYFSGMPFSDGRGLIRKDVGAQFLPEANNSRLRERVCQLAMLLS